MLSVTSYSENYEGGSGAAPAVTAKRIGGWFNDALLRKDIIRFWPLWALYLVVWLLAMPVMQFNTFTSPWRSMNGAERVAEAASSTYALTMFGIGFVFVAALLVAVALFSYLFSTRSTGMMHSFPIRREGLFLTHYAAGVGMFTVVHLIVFALTAAVQAGFGALHWGALGLWLATVTCVTLYFFSFAVFCAQFTGSGVAMVAFYGILSFLSVGVEMLVRTLCSVLIYGLSSSVYFSEPAVFLAPVLKLSEELGVDRSIEFMIYGGTAREASTFIPYLLIYTLAGLALTALALVLYRKRQSESAGDVVSVRWARPIFKYGVAFCSAISLGMGLYALVFQNWNGFFVAGLILCMCICALVGYYAAEMLLCKSFRVFRKGLKGALVTVVVLAAVTVGLRADLFGIASRIPAADQVESVAFRLSGDNYYDVRSEDPELIAEVLQLHQATLAERSEQQAREGENVVYDSMGFANIWLRLTYDLKDGGRMEREYSLQLRTDDLERAGSVASKLDAFGRNKRVLYAVLLGGMSQEEITSGNVDYQVIENSGEYRYDSYSMNASEAQTVYEAIRHDIDAENAQLSLMWGGENSVERSTIYLFTDRQTDRDRSYYQSSYSNRASIEINENFTQTIAVLKELGILNEERQLWDDSSYLEDGSVLAEPATMETAVLTNG